MLHYFAYGSNMLPAQMAERCPGAQLVGPAELTGWRFLITKRGTANITPAIAKTVHGALWRCEPRHIHTLDRFEGVSWRNYARRIISVTTGAGHTKTAHLYCAPRHLAGPARPHYMLTAVIPGARAVGLPEEYIKSLETFLPVNPVGQARSRYRGRRVKSD